MKELTNQTIQIIERAYNSQEECHMDELRMVKNGFKVTGTRHDVYEYFRRYTLGDN